MNQPSKPARSRDEIAAEIKRLLKQHPEVINPPRGGQIPLKRKRGLPATGYKVRKWAAEQGVSSRTMERVVRIARHWPELLSKVDAGELHVRDAERLVILALRDPPLVNHVMSESMSIKEAMQLLRQRNVILLPSGKEAC